MLLAATTDAGNHWRTEGVALPSDLWGPGDDMAFVSKRIGFVVGAGRLVVTIDGGRHWKLVDLGGEVASMSLVGSSLWAVVIGCMPNAPDTPHCPVWG